MNFRLWLELDESLHYLNKIKRMNPLFHGTHTGNLASIKKHGLIPQHGEISKSTDMYQQATEDGAEIKPATFLATDPGYINWHVGKKLNKSMKDVTLDDIRKHGMLVVVRKTAKQVYSYDNPHEDQPPHVERPDYYSMDDVYPKVILSGNDLIKYLSQNYPEMLK